MKPKLLALLIAVSSLSCQPEVQSEEVAATVLNPDYRMCAGCGGTFVKVDSTIYNADLQGYAPNTPVWIRFENNSDQGGIKWITILSIRKQ